MDTYLYVGACRVLCQVDGVLVHGRLHQLVCLGLHPCCHKGCEIQARPAVNLEDVCNHLISHLLGKLLVRELVPEADKA